DDVATHAERVAGTLELAAATLDAAQMRLTGEWSRVVDIPFDDDAPSHLVFTPRTVAQERLVLESIDQCGRLRSELDNDLARDLSALHAAETEFGRVAARWLVFAEDGVDPFGLPADVDDTMVIIDSDRVIINTGTRDDRVEVGPDARSGLVRVTI